MARNNHKKDQPQRQDWKPHWVLDTLHKAWLVIFATAKVALGAVATVVLIGVVCVFAFLGILGEYLENDILPSASLVLEDYDMDSPSYVYNVNENGEIEIAEAPKRRVTAETAQPARRVTTEYKIVSDN